MSKYSIEFKLEVIKYCIENHCGSNVCSKHFNIDSSLVKKWNRQFNECGIKGLSKNNIKYDGNFKLNVVKYMHENQLSATQTSIKFNLGNHSVVSKWEKIYNEEGPQALFEERRGRCKKMEFNQEKKKLNKISQKDLIAENQRLRMEVAYLKKLNALVQERIKRENKKK